MRRSTLALTRYKSQYLEDGRIRYPENIGMQEVPLQNTVRFRQTRPQDLVIKEC